MKLSREYIQRMIGQTGGSGGGGGSVDISSMLAGYATEQFVNQNYVSIDFFKRLFTVHGTVTEEGGDVAVEVEPNDLTTVITDIETAFTFWTRQALSVLGYSDQGGGISLNEPLASINSAGLGAPTGTNVGLVWDGSAWTYGAIGGGGGVGTVTSVGMSVPTGFQISGSPITGSGTLALSFASGYSLPTNNMQTNWQTVYDWYHTYGSQVVMSSALADYLPLAGGTMTNTNLVTNMNADLLDGKHLVTPGGSSTTGYYSDRVPFISSGYVMEVGRYMDWHLQNGTGDYVTRLQLNSSASANVVTMPSGTGTLALLTDTVAGASALKDGQGVGLSKTLFGNTYFNGGVPLNVGYDASHRAGLAYVSNISMAGNISGASSIEMMPTSSSAGNGGFIDFHFNADSGDYTSRIIESESGRLQFTANVYIPSGKTIRLGDGLLSWDSANSAIKVSKYDGTAANFYLLGAVSALGVQSGTGGTDAATITTLTTDRINLENTNNYITRQGINTAASFAINAVGNIYLHDAYFDANSYMHTSRVYLSANCYLYTDGSDLRMNLNGTNYKLTKTT